MGNLSEPHNILVADDDTIIGHMLKLYLEMEGYKVQVVTSVADGVAAAQATPVHLLVSDLQLGDGTGWQLMSKLREFMPIRGIMISGHADSEHRARSYEHGFAEYLTKPVDSDELVRAVSRVLKQDA